MNLRAATSDLLIRINKPHSLTLEISNILDIFVDAKKESPVHLSLI